VNNYEKINKGKLLLGLVSIRIEIEDSASKLSEWLAYLDRNRTFCFKAVGMAGLFGQE
jgi:hypothetical protein